MTDILGSRLYALWNRTAGDCLLDSVLQASWGVMDRDNTLRRALADSLTEAAFTYVVSVCLSVCLCNILMAAFQASSWLYLDFPPSHSNHAGIATVVGKAFSRVCLFVCLFVRALTGKHIEPSTANVLHVYSIAVAWHALTLL